MEYNTKEIIKNSFKNKEKLAKSNCCGCYSCTKVFLFNEIIEYVDDDETAICPFCGIDSVIGSDMSYPITFSFLTKLKRKMFKEFE